MSFLANLVRTKPLDHESYKTSGLRRCLSAFDLTLLGVGAIIGAGIFVLTGVAAATAAGPGIVLSFLLAGLVAVFSALSYAELAASIGGSGSAYGYAFAGFGELVAWIIGWDLLLEYGMSCSAVAIGWAGYINNFLTAVGVHLPPYLLHDYTTGGLVNLPAILIVVLVSILLAIGIRQSTHFNNVMVFVKLAVIAFFVGIASFHFNPANWQPFLPFGMKGVVSGAALIFFAYIGFDAVSTAAEEALRPERDLPIGIIASVAISTLVYMLVAGLLTGMTYYSHLNVSSPVSAALIFAGWHFAGAIVAMGAIAGLTTVILVMFYGFTRVFLAMARDGLLPPYAAKINPSTHTPIRIIVVAGTVIALVAGFVPIGKVAQLVNIGTLAAFGLVSVGVIVLRYTKPDMPRPFKTPLSPLIPFLGAALALYLMLSLPMITWLRFGIWMVAGVALYFVYGRFNSILAKKSL